MGIKILGIETSCDETAVAVVEEGRRLRSNVIASQVELHAPHGGVVPEVASRQHLRDIVPTVEQSLADSGLALEDIDLVAAVKKRYIDDVTVKRVNDKRVTKDAYALQGPVDGLGKMMLIEYVGIELEYQ